MVAPANRNPHFRLLPPADFDPAEPLQLAYNPSVRKRFEVKRTGVIQDPNTGRRIREYMLVDQHANNWVTYLAICLNGEVYQWPTDRNAYLKPSIIAEHGGISADLMDKYRIQAFNAFGRIDAGIRALRKAASETAGKIIAGETLVIEPTPVPNLAKGPIITRA